MLRYVVVVVVVVVIFTSHYHLTHLQTELSLELVDLSQKSQVFVLSAGGHVVGVKPNGHFLVRAAEVGGHLDVHVSIRVAHTNCQAVVVATVVVRDVL